MYLGMHGGDSPSLFNGSLDTQMRNEPGNKGEVGGMGWKTEQTFSWGRAGNLRPSSFGAQLLGCGDVKGESSSVALHSPCQWQPRRAAAELNPDTEPGVLEVASSG